MTYAALTNWKYDKKLYHNIQSGPQHTGSDLNLTDTYELVEGQYVWDAGKPAQTYYGVNNQGADFGVVRAGPPNSDDPALTTPDEVNASLAIFNPGGGNRFYINMIIAPTFAVTQGTTYVLDVGNSTNTGNPFAISETPDGTHNGGVEYTEGVVRDGVPGVPGSTFTWTVPRDSPRRLYYYSSANPGYGNAFIVNPGPVDTRWLYTTDWRAVPPMIDGWWTDYNDYYARPDDVLTVYNGYRRQGLFNTANSTVQSAYGPEPGLRNIGQYTWFGAAVPDNQTYNPFNTPEPNSTNAGITGGPGTYPRQEFPMLTNPTNDSSGSRAAWEYHQPVYCKTYVESIRSEFPGATANVVRNMYRGRSSRYVPNYAGGYGVLGEGVRNLIRTFSSHSQ